MRDLQTENKDLRERIKWIEDSMAIIGRTVDRLVGRIGLEVDISDCNNNGYEILSKNINAIGMFVLTTETVGNFSKEVQKVEASLRDLKQVCSSARPEEMEEDNLE